MEKINDKYVSVCPYCGGTEMFKVVQGGYGSINASGSFRGGALYHIICRKCGSVVRSYVKNPENFYKKKDRKEIVR